jgi:hypothetical protein
MKKKQKKAKRRKRKQRPKQKAKQQGKKARKQERKGKRKGKSKTKIIRRIAIVAVAIALLSTATFGFFYVRERMITTGYIILPAEVQGQQVVVDYLKQTPEYALLDKLCVGEPEVETAFLCSENRYDEFPCTGISLEERVREGKWERTYYWYVRFRAREWLQEPTRYIYLEYIIRGDDGIVVETQMGDVSMSTV